MVNGTTKNINNRKKNNLACSNMTVKHNNTCYMFKWFNVQADSSKSFYDMCKIYKMMPLTVTDLHKLNFILDGTSAVKLQFLSELSINSVNMFLYEKIWLQVKHANQTVDKKFASGFYICHGKTEHLKLDLHNLYRCFNNTFISALHVCDRSYDCGESKSDEMECSCKSFNKHCREICNGPACSCFPLYFKSYNGKCVRYIFQKLKKLDTTENIWKYKSNKRSTFINTKLQDDLVSDFCNSSKNETLPQNILNNKTTTQCKVLGKLPCQAQYLSCYDLHHICIYRLDKFNYLIPCRTGSHIEECKIFQCNQMFKCPDYYCIPWGYVCDGKWDCPYGYDESNKFPCKKSRKCENMFRCKHSEICIPIPDVCNHVFDCPVGDDELLCDLKNTVCPKFCGCLYFALLCRKINNMVLDLSGLPFVAYHLTSCSLTTVNFLKYNQFATVLNLTNNKIGDACNSMSHIVSLAAVDLSRNVIMIISKGCFMNLNHLHTINLQVNNLSLVESKSFQNLAKVKLIDIAHNKLQFLSKNTFYNIAKIYTLKLQNNLFNDINFDMFSSVPVNVIVTNDFHICCISPKDTECTEIPPWYMSCCNLLPDIKTRLLFSIILFVILLGNSFSFLKHIAIRKKKQRGGLYSIIICATNVGDFLCTNYLFLVWMGDQQNGREFIVNQMKWRNGVLCSLAFILILMFNLMMPYMLSLLAFARYMVVIHPMDSNFRSANFVFNCVFGGTFTSLLIAFVSVVYLKFKQIIPTQLCSPFIDPTDSIITIRFLTIGLAILQMSAFCLIIIINFHPTS